MGGVFISHSNLDRLDVERLIYSVLVGHGIETFYSPKHILPGELFQDVIDKALKNCDWFLLAMSPASVASRKVKDEVFWAIDRRPDKILPVFLRKCDPADFYIGLLRLQYIDLTRDVLDNLVSLLARLGVTRPDMRLLESAAVPAEETLPARFVPERDRGLVHSFPGESREGRGKAPQLLLDIDRRVYDSDASFDRLEIADLWERFPKAIMVQTDDDEPSGYMSAFPIAVDIAKRLHLKPSGDNYALPCTSHDPDRAIFLMSEVLTVPAAKAAKEVVWYFDSIAVVSAPERAGVLGVHGDAERKFALLRETIHWFRTWLRRFRIASVITISVSDQGERLLTRTGGVGNPSLKQSLTHLGFGSLEKLWEDEERKYKCWLAKRAKT
jgi:hypothetical protein